MSTDSMATVGQPTGSLQRDILRYSIGVMIPVIVMVMWQWEMAYIAPTLVTLMLAPSSKTITLTLLKQIIIAIAISLGLGVVLTRTITSFPLVSLIVVAWTLYVIFYRAALGENLLITVVLLMSVLAYPSMAALDLNLSIETALGVTKSYLLALVSSLLVQVMLPRTYECEVSSSDASPVRNRGGMSRIALMYTIVLLPIVAAFLMFDLQMGMLTLIYVGVLVLNGNLRKGLRSCVGVLLANFIGGLLAIVCFEFLVIVPIAPFYIFLMFLFVLYLGNLVFTSEKGALFASALSCLLLLITDVTNTTGFDMDYAFYERWIYIALANLYVVGSFMVLTAMRLLQLDD